MNLPFKPNDGGYVRANASGYQILLNYRGPSRYFEVVSMRDILQDRVPPNWGRDRIILIGDVGEIFEDFVFTPYNHSPISSPKRVPRVEIHANLISQIISAAKDGRPLLKTWSEPLEWLWIFLFTARTPDVEAQLNELYQKMAERNR